MKKILSVVLVCFLALGFITVNAQKLESRKNNVVVSSQNEKSSKAVAQMKYCTADMDDAIGTGKASSFSAAISFPASAIGDYVGANLTKIKVAIGESVPGISGCKVWVAKTKTGQRLVEQAFTGVAGQWHEVVLDTPYAITEGELFIGYDITVKGGYPLGVSNNTQNAANGGHLAIGTNWSTLASNKLSGNLCIIGIAEGDFPDYTDMAIKSVNLPKFAKINTDIKLGGSVVNNSNISIASYDVSYKIDGGEATTINVTNANLDPGASKTFEFPAFKFDAEGLKSIEVTVTTTGDELAANNTMTKKISIYIEAVKRKVVMEHFTTEKCPNCPATEKYLTSLVGSNPDVIWVSNHSGYSTDQYTVTEEYLWFFNSNSSYAPAIMLDRAWLAPKGDPGPAFLPSNKYTPALVQERLDTPAYVSLNFEDGVYSESDRKLSFTVSGDKLKDLAGENTVLTVFLIEDNLKSVQPGTPKHHRVLRKVVSAIWGDKITFDGNKFSKTYTTTLDAKYVLDKVSVVAFLSNYDSKNPNNCEVHNGEIITVNALTGLISVNDVEELAVMVYPNPAKDILTIEGQYNTLSIIDVTGKTVKTVSGQSTINVSDLKNGMYILNIVGENTAKTTKIMISK